MHHSRRAVLTLSRLGALALMLPLLLREQVSGFMPDIVPSIAPHLRWVGSTRPADFIHSPTRIRRPLPGAHIDEPQQHLVRYKMQPALWAPGTQQQSLHHEFELGRELVVNFRVPEHVLNTDLQLAHKGPVRPEGAAAHPPRVHVPKRPHVHVRHPRLHHHKPILMHHVVSPVVVHDSVVGLRHRVDVDSDGFPGWDHDGGLELQAGQLAVGWLHLAPEDVGPARRGGLHGVEGAVGVPHGHRVAQAAADPDLLNQHVVHR
mmetsp:Transcript_43578/g.94976  ORF Transcript_43578/g.94976 Transcript_43578/m.94976 type:complete len:261 (-) Transcript_43578:168-950(-)